MKKTALLAAALALSFGSVVHAQGTTTGTTTTGTTTTGTPTTPTTTPPIVSGPSSATNNAVNTQPGNISATPVPGANSFTEGQAQSRIQDRGFTQVTELKLDSQGVWRGKAMKNGQSVDVSMDYQGNVLPQ